MCILLFAGRVSEIKYTQHTLTRRYIIYVFRLNLNRLIVYVYNILTINELALLGIRRCLRKRGRLYFTLRDVAH